MVPARYIFAGIRAILALQIFYIDTFLHEDVGPVHSAPARHHTSLPGGNSEWEPPDSISNSEVKTFCADDSVGFPHVKVGHCRAFIAKSPDNFGCQGFFFVILLHRDKRTNFKDLASLSRGRAGIRGLRRLSSLTR